MEWQFVKEGGQREGGGETDGRMVEWISSPSGKTDGRNCFTRNCYSRVLKKCYVESHVTKVKGFCGIKIMLLPLGMNALHPLQLSRRGFKLKV